MLGVCFCACGLKLYRWRRSCRQRFSFSELPERGGYTGELGTFLLRSAGKLKQDVETVYQLYGQRTQDKMLQYLDFARGEVASFQAAQATDRHLARLGAQRAVAPLNPAPPSFPAWEAAPPSTALSPPSRDWLESFTADMYGKVKPKMEGDMARRIPRKFMSSDVSLAWPFRRLDC